MKKLNKNIFIIILLSFFIFSLLTPFSFAKTEKEELIELLDEYKSGLGDLSQFKQVVDKTYNDLNSADSVTDELKQTLKNDVTLLDNVSGIDSFILVVLKSELNSQIDKLDADTLKDMKEEITVIKEWVDDNVDSDDNPPISDDDDDDSDGTPTTSSTNNANMSSKVLPYAGSSTIIIIITILVIAVLVFSIIKCKKIKSYKILNILIAFYFC